MKIDRKESYLLEVINHLDEQMAMPPDEEELPESEIAILTRLIKQGANWPCQMDCDTDYSRATNYKGN